LWFMNWPNGNPCLIYCFDLQKEVPVLNQFNISPIVKKYNEPALMRECKDGSLWIYGLNVLASFDEQSKTFTQIQSDDSNGKGIYYESANLFEDRNGSIWVCTSNNGLYVFNPSKQLLKSVSHTDRIKLTKGEGAVMSFMTTSNNDLLVGCWGDGLYRYDKHLKPVNLNIQGIEEVNGLTVWGMCRLKTEPVICMIGQPGFIITYNEITGETKRFEPAVFNSVTIRQVLQDKFGNMWYGTHHGGLFKGNALPGIKQMDTGITRFDGIPKTQIRNLIEDHDGNIWVATELYGVYKIDPGSGKILIHLTEKGDKGHNILSNAVSCLLEYNDSLMIIGGGGVNIYNTHSGLVSQVSAVDGLPSDMVVSMEKDNEGFIWIGTMTGLCRMNMQKKTFSYYDRNDGIANDQFDVSASYRLADGRLLFGTSSDFVVFNPSEAAVAINIHPPVITDFSVLNNSLSVDSLLKAGRVDLPADHNSITIGFSNLDYLPGNKLMYFYMMEGIDKEWKKSNELNLAVYNYLPPGTYTFKVKAEYVDFTGNSPVSSIIIKIHPPFWKTWWFISLTIVLFSVLLYWIDRLQLKKKESLLKIRSEIADNLHREIHTALNNINILSEMAKIKADTEPAKSKEYIEQIHTRSHNMINSMDDMLWSLHPGNDSMVKTIWRIREFIDELKSRFTAQIELAVEEKVELLELNMKFRHGALILFKEGIKNLLQAGTKKVSIHIGYEKNKLTFTMQFDNSNCDMQALNNLLHRQDLEKHMQSIHAAMEVQVHKTNSVIVLNIPVTGN
ncbi:MAG: hypothetical protein JST81_14715, partial [Bacteroidetes bacterium]|nr:hypothetical protein [Bacteroidota bacterium]